MLFEDTDNDDQSQAVLSKGIALCERNRLTDLKYSMQHLLARVMFKTNPKAAYKMIENLLPDIEAYNHVQWIYAFRFLRVSLSLRSPQAEINAALQHLRVVSSLAEGHRHIPLLVISLVTETLLQIQVGTPESVELAQRALAAAKRFQLHESLVQVPQLMAMVKILDLACELVFSTAGQDKSRMATMQEMMDSANRSTEWGADGIFAVPTTLPAPEELAEDANGIFRRDASGCYALVFGWLRKTELYSTGYLLSAVVSLQRNCLDERQEKYLKEGIKMTDGKSKCRGRINAY